MAQNENLNPSESPFSAPDVPPLPGAVGRVMKNPFAADVCTDPLGVDEAHSVAGMNQDLVTQIASSIDERHASSGRGGGNPLMLLTAPRAGYGKTHLLGRVAAATHDQVTLVPLAFRFGDEICLPSVGLRGVDALSRADGRREGWSRLREAAAGSSAAFLLKLIKDGKLPCANPEQAQRVLATDPGEIFSEQGSARLIGDWLRKHLAQLKRPLADAASEALTGAPPADLEKWVQVLLSLAGEGGAKNASELRNLASDSTGAGCEIWLRLMAAARPVVLLVDHLDGYYRNEQAGLRLAMLLLDLAEIEGVHVVLSLNQDVWQGTFGHHLPSALEDRLTASQVLLRGLGAEDASEMIRLRLADAGVSKDETEKFQRFLDVRRYFMGRPLGSVSARVFLRHAAQQWVAFQNSVESDLPIEPNEETDDGSLLPVIQEAATEVSMAKVPSVFDTETEDYVKRVAEGLSEPVAALPQNDLPASPPPFPASPPPLIADEEENGEGEAAPAFHSMVATLPTLGAAASARSTGAFEKLREMLDRLRTSEGGAKGPEAVAQIQSLLGEPAVTVSNARDALLGRFEALRLQMAAEAESRQIDLVKIADPVRLAGKRFPLVNYDEVELPGLTGRIAARWTLKGSELLFGLSELNDRRYWQTLALFAAGRQAEIQENSARTGDPVSQFKIVAFNGDRDKELWSQLERDEVFPPTLRSHVDPLHLDMRSIASLYAMQRMIKEAETGAINAEPAQVMSVLARELDFFWKRVTRPITL